MACETYTPTIWVNGTAPAINASNLNNIEGGIKRVADCTVNLEERIATIEQSDVPIGMIVMWSGLEIPTGWVLCDGVHPDAPDLVGKFIRAGNLGTIDEIGGNNDSMVIEHKHYFTGDALPTHSHTVSTHDHVNGSGSVDGLEWGMSFSNKTTSKVSAGTPSGDISMAGGSGINKNIPAYYTLMYIMKVS